MHQAQVKIADLSAKIEQLETTPNLSKPKKITQTIVDQDEQLSWETLYQGKALLLKIKGTNKSEIQPDEICVLSVKKIQNQDHEFYLSGDKRVDESNCQKSSIVIPEQDGSWELEHPFSDQKSRTIKLEKIYQNNGTSKSYIDFTIGKSDQQD